MTIYQSIPAFDSGQLFSATRANQLQRNIEAAYGLDQKLEPCFYAQGNDDTDPMNVYNTWYGYVSYHGDRLVVYMETTDNTDQFRVTFDDLDKAGRVGGALTAEVTGYGPHTIPVSDAAYVEWDVYRIKIEIINEPPYGQIEAYPRYVYMTSSALASIGTMPTFGDGTTLTHTDLNALITGTDKLYEYFNQPIPGVVSKGEKLLCNPAQGTTRRYFDVWFQYRHTYWQSYMVAEATQINGGALQWSYIAASGAETIFWGPVTINTATGFNQVIRASIGGLGLTVGNWYRFRCSYLNTRNDPPMTKYASVWWYGQERYTTAGNWTELPKWEYGDVVQGNAALPPRTPKLANMSSNLNWLNTNRRRWYNPAQMKPRPNSDAAGNPTPLNSLTRTFGRRVHRWLAYENYSTEEGADDPVLYYSLDDTNIFQSYSLPKADTTSYFDMDQSPIKVGMMFYVTNAAYSIQTPETR